MSGGSKVTTQTTEPWDAQKGYLKEGFKQASDIYGKGPADYYTGSTLAGFTKGCGWIRYRTKSSRTTGSR